MIDSVIMPERRMAMLRRNRRLLDKLEELAEVHINVRDGVTFEADDPIMGMRVKQVLTAFGRGFGMDDALNLLDEEQELSLVEITEYSGKSPNRLTDLKGRVIGREGKSKNIIERFTGTHVVIQGKTVGIIGRWQSVQVAREAVRMLLEGHKHGTVFRYLEESVVKI
ncbi:MAG: KH domain-containing protein [Candidatus Aenigmarchaeota archaeon]|nr:KH domain-containing protein [Candidatus Aenigmarchaeota archaeon]